MHLKKTKKLVAATLDGQPLLARNFSNKIIERGQLC